VLIASRYSITLSKRSPDPVARVLSNGELDSLYKWLHDNQLWGLPGDVLSDNMDRFKKDLPEIAEKVLAD